MKYTTKIGTHHGAHADEFVSIALLRKFGNRHFPGIVSAKLEILPTISNAEARYYEKTGGVLVGIGGGLFDEHGKIGDECAATLVAAFLGLIDDPKFFCFLQETRKWDQEAKADKTLIAEVLKVLYEHRDANKVMRWVVDAFDAIIKVIEEEVLVIPEKKWMMEVAYGVQARFMESHKDKDLHERVMTAISETVNNSQGRVTSVAYGCAALRLVAGDDIACEWLEAAFTALYQSQIDFEIALEQIKQSGKRFTSFQMKHVDGRLVRARLECVIVHTDNAKAIRAFRSKRAGAGVDGFDVLIQRNRRGNVQIFSNSKSELDMDSCAQLVRFAEAYEHYKNIPFGELAGQGTIASVPQWHLAKGGQMLNGSKSYPDKEPTRLSDKKLVIIIQHSFDPKGIEKLRGMLSPASPDVEKIA